MFFIIDIRRTVLFLVFFSFFTNILAQVPESDAIRRNGVYAELYVIRHDFSDGFISLNYERFVGKKKKMALRAGIAPDFQSVIAFPFTVSWITGPLKKSHFEYGVGGVFRFESYEGQTYFDFPAVMIPLMYRYQKAKGFFFRGGINLYLSWPILPSPSFSFGYKF